MNCLHCDQTCTEVTGAPGLFYCRSCDVYVEDETWDDEQPIKQFKTKVRPISDRGND